MNRKKINQLRLGLLGPQYTNSDFAADYYQKIAQISYKKIYFSTLSEVFEALEKEKIERALVPLENSIGGKVHETTEQMEKKKINIVTKFPFAIHYSIAVLKGISKKYIEKIISHEQALKQCQKYIKKKFPHSTQEKETSTVASLKKIIKEKNNKAAAIIPSAAAKKFKIKILEEGIEDDKKNTTTFIVIEKLQKSRT